MYQFLAWYRCIETGGLAVCVALRANQHCHLPLLDLFVVAVSLSTFCSYKPAGRIGIDGRGVGRDCRQRLNSGAVGTVNGLF
jgi:hypothetical protein